MQMKKSNNAIFIAATGQNVGKTTLCLGIIAGLQKRYPSVGFIKPVGQQHMRVDDQTVVDKDVVLFKEHFSLKADWIDMSPVLIPSGFTRDYLDGEISERGLQTKIHTAFDKITSQNSYTVVEGTGHVGVGSIVNMNNAKIAASLGLDMVIIASGGLGSSFDELALNISLCREYGVNVRGVLLNRVLDSKREMILKYFPKTLAQWNVACIGCVPYNEFLSTPCMKDFEALFDTTLLAGTQYRYRHFQYTRLIAGSLAAYLGEMLPNQLIITPASREDIISATLQKHIEASEIDGFDFSGGIILTGGQSPSRPILAQIKQVDLPVLYTPMESYDAMKMITSCTAKIRKEDIPKIQKAIKLAEENINFDLLCGQKLFSVS
jgi:BioD-like phosphotransacetylase family protein